MHRRIILFLAILFLPLLATPPAHADTRWCSLDVNAPFITPSGQVRGTAKAFCIGWGSSSRYEVHSIVQQRVGLPGMYRWVMIPMTDSSQGPRSASYSGSYYPNNRYRTIARITIRASNGVVLKRTGYSQSRGVWL